MQLILDFPVNPRYRFDNFVVCSGNRTAWQFAQRLLDVGGGENLLYIYGPAGSGKTHLLTALEGELRPDADSPLPLLSFKHSDEIYGGSYPAEEASRLAESFRDSPALLVDDIHLIPDSDAVRVEVWQLFNDFYQAGKKIIITGLVPPKELPRIDDHLVSRLMWGLVARVDISDDDSRRMILKKLSEDRQTTLPEEVLDYLLVHARRDIPSLAEALERVRRLSLAMKRKITLKLAREAMEGGGLFP